MEPFNEAESAFTSTALELASGGQQRHLSGAVQYDPYRYGINYTLNTFNHFMAGH